MFVDASAIVALLAEPENPALASCLETAEAPITSALAIFEAVTAVARKKALAVDEAERRFDRSSSWHASPSFRWMLRNRASQCGPMPGSGKGNATLPN